MEIKTILSDYENLILIQQHKQQNNQEEYHKLLFKIKQGLGEEYIDNIESKIQRWIDITHHLYFRKSKPVEFLIQAKMLFRDGFYEAAIAMSRSICEMICYDILNKIDHPFGNQIDIEKINFRHLIAKSGQTEHPIPEQTGSSSILGKIFNI